MATGVITIDEAIRYVRLRLDEASAEDSDMVVAEIDDRNLGTSVTEMLRDSVEFIHKTSPIELVAPVAVSLDEFDDDQLDVSLADGVLDIAFLNNSSALVLRFASLKVGDSAYVITRLVPEDSPAARMQLNEYVRGVPDSPVAVLMADSGKARPHIRYYTTELSEPSFDLRIIPVPELTASGSQIEVSEELKLAVLEHLTAEIMSVYGFQQAQAHYQLAGVYAQNGLTGPAVNTA